MFKRFRLKLGISQTRFAKMLGLPRKHTKAMKKVEENHLKQKKKR